MKFLIWLTLWFLLLVLCWPIAFLLVLIAPVVWLLSLPLRLIGVTIEGLFALVRAVFLLPARLLGYSPKSCSCS